MGRWLWEPNDEELADFRTAELWTNPARPPRLGADQVRKVLERAVTLVHHTDNEAAFRTVVVLARLLDRWPEEKP